jgi:hypothetical protein
VAQGILNTADHPLNSGVAFNSQRLHEACKAKGVLELHLLQKEAAQLNTQYQANVPPDEMTVRQLQHTQFYVTPSALKGCDLNSLIHCAVLKQQQSGSGSLLAGPGQELLNKVGDLSSFVGMLKGDIGKLDSELKARHYAVDAQQQQQNCVAGGKPPLQQQLMHQRLLQQKRQILQKQGVDRRQMLRQHSYKIAQQQQVLPPLPLNESESEDLLAFQAIVEGAPPPQPGSAICDPTSTSSPTHHPPPINGGGSPKLMKTSHINLSNQIQTLPPINGSPVHASGGGTGDWSSSLQTSMQTCQISESSATAGHENWTSHVSPAMYQVYTTSNQ